MWMRETANNNNQPVSRPTNVEGGWLTGLVREYFRKKRSWLTGCVTFMLDLSFLVAFETGFNICHLVTNSFISAVLNLSTSFDISQKDKNEIQVLPVHPFTEHLRDFILKVILILTLRWDLSHFVFVLLIWGLNYNGKIVLGEGIGLFSSVLTSVVLMFFRCNLSTRAVSIFFPRGANPARLTCNLTKKNFGRKDSSMILMVLSKTSCYNRLDHRGWKRRLIISISRGLWLWFWCRKTLVPRWEVNK